jgi:hypothetical protein
MRTIRIVEFSSWKEILSHKEAHFPAIWFFLGTDYRSLKELQAGIGTRMQEVEFGGNYHETVNRFRQKYVDYIGSLNAAEKYSLEQYSGFREKSPFISNIFQTACYIQLAQKILNGHRGCPAFIICQEKTLVHDLFQTLKNAGMTGVQLSVSGPAISFREKVYYYARGSIHITYTGLIIFARMLLTPQSAKVTRAQLQHRIGKNKVILIHTWMSRNSSVDGYYHEGFFGDLQKKLQQLEYDAILVPHIPYDLPFKTGVTALEHSGTRFLTEEQFLSPYSLLCIIGSCFLHLPHLKEYSIEGIVITNTVQFQQYRDWESLQLLMPLFWEAITQKFSSDSIRIRSFILLHENYSFEKAIIEGFRSVDDRITMIGYQHSTVTSNHISYCISQINADKTFLPDLIITNGTFPREVLIRNNYPSDIVVVGGALRYIGKSGTQQSSRHVPAGKDGKYIILTLPGVLDESVEIIEKVYEALHSDSRRVIVKIHPFIPEDRLAQSVKRTILNRFEFTGEPLERILPDAALLIYSTSSTCVDALSCGIPVLRVLSDRRLDIDPLLDFRTRTPYIGVATHPHEIDKMMEKLTAREFSLLEQKELAEIVRSIFGPVTSETYTLFTFLKKYGDQQ